MLQVLEKQSAVDHAPAPAADVFDLADLVALLMSSERPDRRIDLLVGIMLAGEDAKQSVHADRVRRQFWLYGQTPPFTDSVAAVRTVAHARGLRLSFARIGDDWAAEARNPLLGTARTVRHRAQCVAGLVAVAAMVSSGSGRE